MEASAARIRRTATRREVLKGRCRQQRPQRPVAARSRSLLIRKRSQVRVLDRPSRKRLQIWAWKRRRVALLCPVACELCYVMCGFLARIGLDYVLRPGWGRQLLYGSPGVS